MSVSLVMRAVFAATALAVAPTIASAQAPQTKSCKDGSSSTRSTFACWGHGGVDTSHAAERPRAVAEKHHEAEAVQAGSPHAKPARSTAHKASKAKARHAKAEHHEPARAAKTKQDEGHRGWLPWHHKKPKHEDAKKAKHDDAKKKKKHKSSHAPLNERPNGQPR